VSRQAAKKICSHLVMAFNAMLRGLDHSSISIPYDFMDDD